MEFEEQLPDFILADKTGLIANGKSTIKCFNDSILVSANSTLHVYDMKSLELKENVTESIKYMITEFSRLPSDVGTGDVICYENGTIKVMKDSKVFLQYRPHYKKVNNLVLYENYIISSSTDNIVLYDIYTEEIKVWYKGLAGGVVKIAIDNEQLYVLSTDCCIRVYNMIDENTKEIHTFDNNVADFIVRNHQILLIFLDGSSKIYNSNTKEYKNFDSFKYFVTVNVYGDCLAILTTDKLHCYKGLNDDATLKKVTTIPLKQKFMDFDLASENELVLISKNNTLKKINIQTKLENTISHHQNEIFETVLIDNDIITCSSERYIVWTIDGDSVEKLHTCLFDFHAHSISKFDQNILVSSNEKMIAYDYKNNTVLFELQINNKLVKYAKGKLFVIYEDNLKIFDVSRSNNEISLNLLREDTFDSHCVFLNTSNDGRLYAISLLNNYINIYNADNNDLKLTLYGHSLPVRYFEFSDDNKALISCGTDKLVKLWGVDFGECRKTFIADSKKISFVTNNSFVSADSGIKYYKKHDLIKHYKIKDIERTTYDKNKLIATSKFGIYHYKIGEYEFLEKEESSELEEELMKETNIINYKSYDRFLEQLNTLEDDREASMDGLFEAIKAIDLAEIDKFTYFLNQQQVKIIFTCLERYFESFPVVSIRFCKELIKTHSYMCSNNKEIFKIYNEMKERCKNVMDEAGCNLFEYSMLFDYQ